MKKPPRETPSIQSLDRGLLILEAVAKSSEPVSLAQLAELLDIDRSSVFRLANTLKRRGFLAYPRRRKDYMLGPSISRLSRHYNWDKTLADVSREHLKHLAFTARETAHLAVREGQRALFIDHASINQVISVAGQTGELVPLYCTAHGKSLLSDFSLHELESLFGTEPLHRYTPRTLVSVSDLAVVCSQIKSQGYSTDDAEFQDGMRCVAAPIRDEEGVVVGCIGISAPLARFPNERYPSVAKQVCDIAGQISRALSSNGDH